MKYLVALFAVVALASCGTKTTTVDTTTVDTENTNSALVEELEIIEEEFESEISNKLKVEELTTTFKTPGGEVEMTVSYALDDEGMISYISINSSYSHKDFNKRAEAELLGKSIEEAKELYISGASLASDAFKEVIKNA